MSAFASFLKKYASEALSVAGTLNTLLEGLALSPKQAAGVKATIDKLEAAAESIAGSLDKADGALIKISKADINAAVKDVLQPLVAEEVAKAFAAATAPAPQDGAA